MVCVSYVYQSFCFVSFQAEDGIRYLVRSRGLGDVYKRQKLLFIKKTSESILIVPLNSLSQVVPPSTVFSITPLLLSLIHI